MAARKTKQMLIEALEGRQLLSSVSFGVIGDYGYAGQPELDVANRVKSWNPAFIATTGDNNYPSGEATTVDRNIGQYYSGYIGNYKGSYGSGSTTGNRFFPVLGNHDYVTSNGKPYFDYFTLPNNERYYTYTNGPVQIFAMNSEPQEADGTSSTSVQANWLKNQLAASNAPWKIVLMHQSPYSSSATHGSNTTLRWPYQQWGADAVITGHDHTYERVLVNNFPYFVNGLGGKSIYGFGTPISGSQVRYNGDYGAMKVDATDTSLTFRFITRSGSVIDTYTINAPTTGTTAPAAPSGLSATAASSSQINLAWTDNSTDESGFKIERSTDGTNFAQIATVAAGVKTYSNTGLSASSRYYYRVRAYNSAGDSAFSNAANATTLAGGTAAGSTYLSDMNWSSATIGWGSVHKDASVEGRTLKLNGASYAKGLGTHANSTITYNLGGQYSNFAADVGVDDEVGSNGAVGFQAFADGNLIYDSGTMTGATATKSLNVNVAGANQLVLKVTDAGNGINYDHADWANARLTASTSTGTTAPAAPSGLSATAASSSQINLAWTDNSTNESGFKIERSSDGTNFSQIATVAAGVKNYSNTGLSASTQYYYRVRAYNSAGDSAFSNTANATTSATSTASGTTYLSDMNWRSASIGWGSVHKDQSVEGRTLKLNGVSYAKGIGTHANSTIVYDLGGQYSSFLADIGVDDEVGRAGSVMFQVLADGVKIYDSGTMTGTSATKSLNLSVSGVRQLTLVVTDAGNGMNYDHADWANARLIG